jgi:hypothetical protein
MNGLYITQMLATYTRVLARLFGYLNEMGKGFLWATLFLVLNLPDSLPV